MNKLICQICNLTLSQKDIPNGKIWKCNACNGIMANSAVLKKYLNEKIVREFYRRANTESIESDRTCPSCRQKLYEFKICHDVNEIYLDICRTCQIIWFDEGELCIFPKNGNEDTSDIVKKEVALAKIKLENERIEQENKIKTGMHVIDYLVHLIICTMI